MKLVKARFKGDLMTIQEFRDAILEGMLTDYDGYGIWATLTEEDAEDYRLEPSSFRFETIPGGITHVKWFNQ